MEVENANMMIRNNDVSIYRPYQEVDDRRRVLQHITTDKPFYKKGDIVFVEVFLVDALTKIPFNQRQISMLTAQPMIEEDVLTEPRPAPPSLDEIYGYVEILDSQDT